jgi:hypothetical protein
MSATSRLRAIGAVAVVAVSAVVVASAGSSRAATAAVAAPSGQLPAPGVLFGASEASVPGGTAATAFAALESSLGRGLALDRSYSRWDDRQPTPLLIDDAAHGRVPLLSIKPQLQSGKIVTWASIASGAHDAEIRAQADALRDSHIPLILTMHHEPELSTGYGTAADYVGAFRHYVAVFRAEAATNVAFAVVLGASTYANPAAWYPGDDVVDWIGADAYNFAACVAGQPAWRSLATVASAFYAWGSARGKPLVLAEWGSAEDPALPGRKAQWLHDAAATLAGWPQIKAVAYFDRVGTCDWRITTSATSATAFAEVARSAWANGAPSARLVLSAPVGAAPLAESFDASSSTGAGSASGSGVASWTLDFGDQSPPATGTGQPGTVTHTYSAGHWTASLTVVDATGASATMSQPVVSAGPPSVVEGNATSITSVSAVLPAWINTSGLAGSYYVGWGVTTALGAQSTPVALTPIDKTQPVLPAITGLQPATKYYWRIVATSAGGTTVGPQRSFVTTA